jgi:hypothetical protein
MLREEVKINQFVSVVIGRLQQRWLDSIVMAALVGLVVVFFWPVLVLDIASVPFDMQGWHYPQQAFLAKVLRGGEWPVWNPYVYGGMPVNGNIQTALFYPMNILMLLLSNVLFPSLPYRLLEMSLAFHYLLAGITSYWLARYLNISRPGAFIASLVYMFGPFLISQAQHYNLIMGSAWVPLVLLAAYRVVMRPNWRWSTLLGVLFGLHIVTGFVPATMSLAVGLLAIFGWATIKSFITDNARLIGLARLLLHGVWAASLAACLTAIQLIPLVELSSMSIAAGRDWAGAYPTGDIWTLIIPDFFVKSDPTLYRGGNYTKQHFYLPPMALALITAALTGQRARMAALLMLGAMAALLASLDLVNLILPLLSWIPQLLRGGFELYTFRVLADLGVALLVGLGLDNLMMRLPRASRLTTWLMWGSTGLVAAILVGAIIQIDRLVPTDATSAVDANRLAAQRAAVIVSARQNLGWLAGTALVLLGLQFWRRQSAAWSLIAVGGIGGLIVAPLFVFGAQQPFNSSPVPSTYSLGPTYLDGESTGAVAFLQHLRDRDGPWRFEYGGVTAATWATAGQFWGLESINGHDPFLPSDTAAFRRAMATAPDHGRPFRAIDYDSPLLRLFNVRYVIGSGADHATTNLRELDPDVDMDRYSRVYDSFFSIYEARDFLPRALVVPTARVVQNRDEMLRLLVSGEVEPTQVALIERIMPYHDVSVNALMPSINYEMLSVNRIRVAVNGSSGGVLVILDPYWPGWEATIDGVPTEVWRANYLFRAMPLPPGDHVVEMEFRPLSLRVGLVVSVVGLMVTLLILGLSLITARRRSAKGPPMLAAGSATTGAERL